MGICGGSVWSTILFFSKFCLWGPVDLQINATLVKDRCGQDACTTSSGKYGQPKMCIAITLCCCLSVFCIVFLYIQQWRRRFFVLYAPPRTSSAFTSSGHSAFLHYYESEKIAKKKGFIDLDSCEELRDRLKSTCYRHLFSLKTFDHGNIRTYYLAADSEAEMDVWVDYLAQILDLRRKYIEYMVHF